MAVEFQGWDPFGAAAAALAAAQAAGSAAAGCIPLTALVTTVGDPGSNSSVPSEAAVRTALTAAVSTAEAACDPAGAAASAQAAAEAASDPVGSAATVQGNLNTHAALTTTAHGGLIASSALVTAVGDPGSDGSVPSEKAVRSAISTAETAAEAASDASGAAAAVQTNLNTHAALTTTAHGGIVAAPSGTTVGHVATFAAGGQIQDGGAPASVNSQTVIGPASTTVGHLALFNNTSGTLLEDGGAPLALANLGGSSETIGGSNSSGSATTAARSDHTHGITNPGVAIGPGSSTTGHMATFADTGGYNLSDGGAPASVNSQTVIGPASTTVGHLALFNNASGTLLEDGGAPLALANLSGSSETIGGSNSSGSATTAARSDHTHGITNPGVAIGPASSTAGHLATFADTGGKNLSDGGAIPSGWSIANLSGGAETVGGSAVNGSTGNAADAGHKHAITQPPANQGRWVALVGGTDFTTTPASSSTITMLTNQTANIPVGTPVMFTNSGGTYYAQVTALTSGLMTIRGDSLGSATITGLSYDTLRNVEEFTLNVEAAWTSTGVSLAGAEGHYLTFDLPAAHLIGWKATLGTPDSGSAQPYIQPYINGALGCNSTQMSSSAGTFVSGGVWSTGVSIGFGQTIDVQCPTLGTNKTAAKLNVELAFVIL
jgi:hypothetical protein